jgi:hypothetical protein
MHLLMLAEQTFVAGVGLLFAFLLFRSSMFGVFATTAMFIAEAVAIELPGINLGIWAYPQDILSVLLASIGLLRLLLQLRRLGRLRLVWIGFFCFCPSP